MRPASPALNVSRSETRAPGRAAVAAADRDDLSPEWAAASTPFGVGYQRAGECYRAAGDLPHANLAFLQAAGPAGEDTARTQDAARCGQGAIFRRRAGIAREPLSNSRQTAVRGSEGNWAISPSMAAAQSEAR